MRIGTCTGLASAVTVVGSKETVTVHPGWTGDVDQVVGESDGKPVTLADALGPLLEHIEIAAPTKSRRQPALSAPIQE